MLARTLGYGLSGVSGFAVKVEVYAATGMPALEIIGLPDASVKESRDRVSAAIVNSGFTMPISRLTVNLAPADQRSCKHERSTPSPWYSVSIVHHIARNYKRALSIWRDFVYSGEKRMRPTVRIAI